MIRVWKTNISTKLLEKRDKITKGSWIEMTSPTMEEIEEVASKTLVDKELLAKMLDTEELPRLEESDNGNGVLIVIDTPHLGEKGSAHKYKTYPLGIVVTKNNYVITLAPKKSNILDNFKTNKVKDFRTTKKTRFLIQILLQSVSLYLKALKEVNSDIAEKEEVLKLSTENEDLIELLDTEKTLVYFITSLKANELVLEKLSKGNMVSFDEDDIDLLDDAIIENQQAIEMSGIYKDILSSITGTYGTVVSNNQNTIMKFLAGITIVLSIPTIISSFIGMNVPITIANYDHAFSLLVILSFVVSVFIAWLLKKKNML